MGYVQDRLQGQITELLRRIEEQSKECIDRKMEERTKELQAFQRDPSLTLKDGSRIRDIRKELRDYTPICEKKE